MKSLTSRNSHIHLPYGLRLTIVPIYTYKNFQYTYYINMHSNSLPLVHPNISRKLHNFHKSYQFGRTDSQGCQHRIQTMAPVAIAKFQDI